MNFQVRPESENHMKYMLQSHEHVWTGTKGWSCSLSQISCFGIRQEILWYLLQMKTVGLTLIHHYFHFKFQTLGQRNRKNNFFLKRDICQIVLHFGIRSWCFFLFFVFFFLTTVETVEMPGLDAAFGGKRQSRVATVPAMLVNFKCPRSYLVFPSASLQENY